MRFELTLCSIPCFVLQVIKDEHLFLMVGALVLVDVLILILWTAIDPMTRELEIFEDKVSKDWRS